MSLLKSQITVSAREITEMVKSKVINFDHILQRSYVWERWRKSELIESAILGYPIPIIYSKKIVNPETNKSVYYIMDGKQRLNSLYEYLTCQYKLTDLNDVVIENFVGEKKQYKIANMFYDDLDKSLQDRIANTMFTIVLFDDLTPLEEREIFRRLNNGKPLTVGDRVVANCNDVEKFEGIKDHKLFTVLYDEVSRKTSNYIFLLAKIWLMLYEPIETMDFTSDHLKTVINDIQITEHQRDEIIRIFDYLYEVGWWISFKMSKKFAAKAIAEKRVIHLVKFIRKAIEKNIPYKDFSQWVISLVESDILNPNFVQNKNIVSYQQFLQQSFDKYFSGSNSAEQKGGGNNG